MFGRKGQGAMEYLMTYGWAILVVMIVGIVMWQLGIFNLGTSSVTSTGFAKIKPQLTSCKMTSAGLATDGVFSCLFTNGAGTAITITSWSVNGTSPNTCVTLAIPTAPIGVGDNVNINATSCMGGSAGQAYSVNVYFAYTQSVAGTTVSHSDFGSVRGPYET